ncbi:MAG: sulfite exporter TauE/SafE family protein, partial [Aureliella sp.]
MWILVSAVVTSSLLGSMHCVGMCGPLAIWASGAGDRISTHQMTVATTLYHLGRLLTYALVGMLAGAAGQLVDMGG